MKVTCAICGYQSEVPTQWLRPAEMLAFFAHRRPRSMKPDIWICDIHK